MCGVPYHAAEIYIQRLLRKGYRIALCEQMEDPKTVKGIVKREVTRVLTPGTAVDPGMGAGESCWLASVVCLKAGVGVALVDLSTGEFRATEFGSWELAADELARVKPVELVYAQGWAVSRSGGWCAEAGRCSREAGRGGERGAGRHSDENGSGRLGNDGRACVAFAAATVSRDER